MVIVYAASEQHVSSHTSWKYYKERHNVRILIADMFNNTITQLFFSYKEPEIVLHYLRVQRMIDLHVYKADIRHYHKTEANRGIEAAPYREK